jgi:hypothetical protein
MGWRLALTALAWGLIASARMTLERAQTRALRWTPAGELVLETACSPEGQSVQLRAPSQRVGRHWLILWLASAGGSYLVFLNGRHANPAMFRRFCREVLRGSPESV